MIILALVLIPFVAGSIIVWQSAKNAPDGFQNETGFHFSGEATSPVRHNQTVCLPVHAKEEFALSA